MATLTLNISNVSLAVSGNTQKSTNITWTPPTVPDNATITSCKLTGTATASMTKGSATITVNGATVYSGNNFTVNLGTDISKNSVAVTTKGGNKNASGTVTFSNLVYTVVYEAPYTVTFVDWDGTVLDTQAVKAGESAVAPSNPVRSGYVFTGWDKTFTNVQSDLTVTAQYVDAYTVTFVDYDGTVLKTEDVISGGSATAPSNPIRSGYIFTGWDKPFSNVTSNLSVTAQYVAAYTVTFLDYDGTVLKTEDVIAGGDATAPEVDRYGYTLSGWSVDFSNVNSNITTVAQYDILSMLSVKENNNWVNIVKIYQKINGVWVEQKNSVWKELFNSATGYIQQEMPIPMAVLYSDGTLIFSSHSKLDDSHGEVVDTYTGWDTDIYEGYSRPWSDAVDDDLITSVYFDDVYIESGKKWFSNSYGASRLNKISGIAKINSSTSKMFEYSNVKSIDLSNFDTSSVTDMSEMFYECNELTSLNLINFDTGNVINMSKMFSWCSSLTSLDLSNFDTSNVIDMSGMFNVSSSLTSLDLSNFNTSNVTNMSSMFGGCSSLTSLDLSSFDTSNVTDMSGMFTDIPLTSLDVSNFDTSNVTTMWNMFRDCSGLTSLDLSNFDTSNVTTMFTMFRACSSLTSLDLSNFNTSNVTNMSNMFCDCSSLISLDVSSFNTSNVTNMSDMFYGCSSLVSLDLSNFDMTKLGEHISDTANMFSGCTSLKTIYVKDNAAKTKIASSSGFPSTATVIVGKPA